MEFESYEIDISRIKNSDIVCWQYTTSPTSDEEWKLAGANIYCKLSPITEALAVSSDYVHLTSIKPSNLMEWFYRLDALFDAEVGFLFVETREGEIPIRVTLNDLKTHLGLQIEINHWDTGKFDKSIRHLRMQNHLRKIL